MSARANRDGVHRTPTSDALVTLADFVALAYHEARNVRYLTRTGDVDAIRWKSFVSLPSNRDDAWSALQMCRQKAYEARSPVGVFDAFAQHFGQNLDDLQQLSANPNWRHAAPGYGGEAWRRAVGKMLDLGYAITHDEPEAIEQAIDQLKGCRHNTGLLTDKLKKLDVALENPGT